MSDPFTVSAGPLFQQIRRDRAEGRERAAAAALEELLALYVRLGRRELGTVAEQNNYIVARHLGFVPADLQPLGVKLTDLPEPPGRRPALPSPADPTVVDTAEIAERLARIGNAGDEPPPRYGVAFRPQDNVVRDGRPQAFAVVDRQDNGLPVAWYDTREWTEVVAGIANRLRVTG